jgi:hypothetical protein
MKKSTVKVITLIALALVLVSLLQWTPVDAIAKAVSAQSDTYTPGDVNNDGRINALDVNLVRRYIAGGYDVKINTLAADVDADGYVTEKDVKSILDSKIKEIKKI